MENLTKITEDKLQNYDFLPDSFEDIEVPGFDAFANALKDVYRQSILSKKTIRLIVTFSNSKLKYERE